VTVSTQRGPWVFRWEGGRTADVFHLEREAAVDCVQVPGWDWQRGVNRYAAAVVVAATGKTYEDEQEALEQAADGWMKDSEPDYRRELPWLR